MAGTIVGGQECVDRLAQHGAPIEAVLDQVGVANAPLLVEHRDGQRSRLQERRPDPFELGL
jgi:hypothetical protein